MKNRNVVILEYLLIVAVGVLQALEYSLFIVPNNFAPAGVNGIAAMIQYKLHFSIAYMSLLVNIPLCVAAYFLVNKKFAVRTMLFSLVFSLTYLVFQNIDILDRFKYYANNIDTIYPVIISGILTGFVYGTLFGRNACSGGTDVVARIVAKKRPYMNFFWITFFLNAVVALASYFVYAQEIDGVIVYNLKPVCLCISYCYISSFVGSTMLKEARAACEFTIITEYPDEIEQEILNELHRSATRIKGVGVYSGTEKTVLICLTNKAQRVDLEAIIAKYPGTFSIEKNVIGTVGNFKKIKVNEFHRLKEK